MAFPFLCEGFDFEMTCPSPVVLVDARAEISAKSQGDAFLPPDVFRILAQAVNVWPNLYLLGAP